MRDTYYIGVYWGTRKETFLECVERVEKCFRLLKDCDPLFQKWYRRGSSRNMALQNSLVSEKADVARLMREMNKVSDLEVSQTSSLGFRLGLWTQDQYGTSIGLNLRCGCYDPIPGVNSVTIDLPDSGGSVNRILNTSKLTEIIKALVIAWEPDWGVVNSNAYQANRFESKSNAPRVGWILYLGKHRGDLPSLPQAVTTAMISNSGWLIAITEDVFTASNTNLINLADEVQQLLSKHGLLGPLT